MYKRFRKPDNEFAESYVKEGINYLKIFWANIVR